MILPIPPVDTEQAKNIVVCQIPQPSYSDSEVMEWGDDNESLLFLLNSPARRHKSANYCLFCSNVVTAAIQLDKIGKLYWENKDVFPVDLSTFYSNYMQMYDLMQSIVPESATCVTEVSKVDETLFNYYEFEDKKIFFNLYFDEDSSDASALVNIKFGSEFISVEGTIEQTVDYLKGYLNASSHERIS